MNKKKLIGKQVAIWPKDYLNRGMIGEIIDTSKTGVVLSIQIGETKYTTEHTIKDVLISEIYFPNHIDGYNQPCFQ